MLFASPRLHINYPILHLHLLVFVSFRSSSPNNPIYTNHDNDITFYVLKLGSRKEESISFKNSLIAPFTLSDFVSVVTIFQIAFYSLGMQRSSENRKPK